MAPQSPNWAIPISTPPPGVTPDFVHPPSIAYRINITGGLCIGLVVVFYGFRIYASVTGASKQNKWWNEAVVAVTAVLVLMQLIMGIAIDSFFGGFGVHEWDVLLENFTNRTPLLLTTIQLVTYAMVMFWIKLSLTLLYLDLFGRLTWFRWSCYIQIFVLGLFYLSATVAFGTLCAPSHDFSWLNYVLTFGSRQCARAGPLGIGVGDVNLVTDVILFVLPLLAVWSLNMPVKRKMGVSVMFLIGLCAVIASCLSMYYRVLLKHDWKDVTYWTIPGQAVGMGEMTAGLIIVCMPSVATVLRQAKGPGLRFYISLAFRSLSHSRSDGNHSTWRAIYSSDKSAGVTNSDVMILTTHSVSSEKAKQTCSTAITTTELAPEVLARPQDAVIRKETTYSVVCLEKDT